MIAQSLQALVVATLLFSATGASHAQIYLWDSYYKQGITLLQRGRLSEAEANFMTCIRECQGIPNPRARQQALINTLSQLGMVYQEQSKFQLAEETHRQALQNCTSFGSDSLLVAMCCNNLANLYLSEGKLIEARALYDRALPIFRRAGKKEAKNYGVTLSNISAVDTRRGNFKEAEEYCKQSIVVLGGCRDAFTDVARSNANLAQICLYRGKYDEADQCYQRALTQMVSDGTNRSQIGPLVVSYAQLQIDRGAARQGKELLDRGLRLATTNQPNSMVLGSVLLEAASAQTSLRDFASAEQALHQAREILSSTGDEISRRDYLIESLRLKLELLDFNSAERVLQSLDRLGEKLGDSLAAIPFIFDAKAQLLSAQNKKEEAQKNYEKAIGLWSIQCPQGSVGSLDTKERYAKLLHDAGDHEKYTKASEECNQLRASIVTGEPSRSFPFISKLLMANFQ